MRFAILSFVLVAASCVSARAIPSYGRSLAGPDSVNVARKAVDLSGSVNNGTSNAGKSQGAAAKNGKAASSKSKSKSASKTVNNSSNNSNSSSNANSSSNSNATATNSAASATRTRVCDQGDQSLAAGLQAAVVIGLGQQASVLTLQSANNTQDISDGITRLQQFVDTMKLQLQMAQTIADDGSIAQTQLKLLASSQTSQEKLVTQLSSTAANAATQNAQTLDTLLQSFLDSTNNAQDGASNALIDCFLPTTVVSG